VACPKCGAKNRVDERARTAQAVCGKCGTPLPVSSADCDQPVIVTDATFQQFLSAAGSRPALIDCWAPWCGPCRMLTPTIEALARESAGRWVIGKLNVDENQRTASRFNISSIPAMLIFQHGQLIDQLVGLQPKQAIESRLAAASR